MEEKYLKLILMKKTFCGYMELNSLNHSNHYNHVSMLIWCLDGFLNGYFISRYHFQNGAIPWLSYYWKKFERTAPLYAMMLGFYAILFPYMGSGPVWPTYDTNPVCKEYWWWNLFFINNLQSSWKQVTIL
ncbi:nose resistant to fluoxetine protein 6 [Trichonephila clavata]|uniref:Nose resistant to fluoxetine protein 6 n=1 Tax=Trichonephila clavata TaxID=2740835 RepID=A0A8X6M261_TRICU|nr:nose resistant to fluoxetine protein 6 [Trichonephila clavata]